MLRSLAVVILATGCHLAHYHPSIVSEVVVGTRVALQVQTLTDPRGTPGPARTLMLALEPTGPIVIEPTSPADHTMVALLEKGDPRPKYTPPQSELVVFAGGLVDTTEAEIRRISLEGVVTPLLELSPIPECARPVRSGYTTHLAVCASTTRVAVVKTLWSRCEALVQTTWMNTDGTRAFPDTFTSYTPGPTPSPQALCATRDDGSVLAAVDGALVSISPGGATSSQPGPTVFRLVALENGFATISSVAENQGRIDFLDAAGTRQVEYPIETSTQYRGSILTSDGPTAIVIEGDGATLLATRVERSGRITKQSIDLASYAPPAIR